MSRIAVKLYRDAENPHGIPSDWPCEIYVIDDHDVELRPGFTLNMSKVQYDEYIRARQSEFDAWLKKGTLEERLARVEQAHTHAVEYIAVWHDDMGMLKMNDWVANPTTPKLCLARIAAVRGWIDMIMGYYLTIAKPLIMAGEHPDVVYSMDAYRFLGDCPYTFTEIYRAAIGVDR